MSPVELRNKNDCECKGQRQFTRQPDSCCSSLLIVTLLPQCNKKATSVSEEYTAFVIRVEVSKSMKVAGYIEVGGKEMRHG
jgi:hypothetical protein